MNLESKIDLLILPFKHHRAFLDGPDSTGKGRATRMQQYMAKAEKEGFTSFNSYKVCSKIMKLITDNRAFALTSNDDFVRTLAESIKTTES